MGEIVKFPYSVSGRSRSPRGAEMTAVEYLDQPPVGWFVFDVMRAGSGRKWDWCALMIDVHEAWLRVPGKHRNKKAAEDALQNLLASNPQEGEA
jgi:hypothetical protein